MDTKVAMKEADLYHNNSEYVFMDEYKRLEKQLKEAEKVIEFYGDAINYDYDNAYLNDDISLISFCPASNQWEEGESGEYKYIDYCGGRTAREYLTKYKIKE